MRELSIEEKASRYDKAIKRVENIKTGKCETIFMFTEGLFEHIFPELAESEDEKIREDIVTYLAQSACSATLKVNAQKFNKWIAWLEKKVKEKPVISDDALREGIIHFGITQYQISNWLKKYVDVEKQGEQKSLSNNTDSTLEDAWHNLYDALHKVHELEKQGEQNPTQEIEPTPIFRIGNILKRKGKDYTFRVDRIQGGYYHCDRNYGAFFPIEEQGNWELVEQPSAWSEEDENRFRNLIYLVEHSNEGKGTKEGFVKFINRLKALKDRYAWKPSAEQMERLKGLINSLPHQEVLYSLYQELKKLKG